VKAPVASLLCVLLLAFLPVDSSAGLNAHARATLSWDPDLPSCDWLVMPEGQISLYVQLLDIVELAGCEFSLTWHPEIPPSPHCYEILLREHPSGTGNDCTWLMRGEQVLGMDVRGDNYWDIAFAAYECDSVCSRGNVARMVVDVSGCQGDVGGWFCLHYLKVTDCAAYLDVLRVNDDALVLSGEGAGSCPCGWWYFCSGCNWGVGIAERTTWGAVKALYK